MKTILITGIAGFLGSHIAEHCLRNGHRVIGVDNLSGGVESNAPPGARFIKADICDEAAINRIFSHIKIDVVIHCAAFASENLSHNCRLHTYNSIVIGSATLVNAAVNNGVELFIGMSSIAVYGAHNIPPFTELGTPGLPCDPYGCAKICAEMDLLAAEENFGMKTITFRPHNIIGVRQNLSDKTRNVASIFIRQALTGKPMTIYGSGQQTRAWSPVCEVASIIASAVDRPESWGNTYNIGGEVVMRVHDLAMKICHIMDHEPDFIFLPGRNEAVHAHASHERLNAMFGEPPVVQTIDACLVEMVREARKMTLRPIQPLPPIEINKLLNPAWNLQP